MRRNSTAILVAALLIAGCGGDAGEETTTSTAAALTTEESTTTVGVAEVEVVKDLVYHPESERLREALLDVYALPGAEGGPVVVLLHGDGRQKSSSPYPALAGALAELGAVVFVPDWQTGPPITSTTTREDLLDVVDGLACAVSYALAHAAEYGADPGKLVLFGHSAGANFGSVAGLREAVPLPECAVEMTPFVVGGMVLWEGDWLISSADPSDQYGDSLPLMMEGATPWSWLATGPRMAVDLVTTWGGRAGQYLCDVSDPEAPYWERDPEGWFRERLEAIGALEDGCIDVGEPTRILADTMREQGFDVVEVFLENSDHYHFSPDDQALVVTEVIAIADR